MSKINVQSRYDTEKDFEFTKWYKISMTHATDFEKIRGEENFTQSTNKIGNF